MSCSGMARRIPPISLRLSNAETLRRARDLLAQFKQGELTKRRIKWQATKAIVSVLEMERLMSADERARWRTECETVRAFLKKIMDRGA
jgi:hypothetical protein